MNYAKNDLTELHHIQFLLSAISVNQAVAVQ